MSTSKVENYVTTDGQSASLSWCQAHIWGPRPLSDSCEFVDVGRHLWREGGSVVYNYCLRQRSHSRIRVPQDSWPYLTVLDSRLPQTGGPGPRIYIPQEQSGPVIPPGTGFLIRRLLRLAGLRWRYSTPSDTWSSSRLFDNSVRTSQETLHLCNNDHPVNVKWGVF
jgi:hypothetical protein